MGERLESIARRIALGAIATIASGQEQAHAAAPVDDDRHRVAIPAAAAATEAIVLKSRRPRLVLLAGSPTTPAALLTSHRSHRSHSSHRSHYSSRSSPPPAPSPARRPAPAAVESTQAGRLGSRVLQKGMNGGDVGELMLLLVKRGFLKPDGINTDKLFTAEVERAVKAFQRAAKLTENGRVNAATVALLLRDPEGL